MNDIIDDLPFSEGDRIQHIGGTVMRVNAILKTADANRILLELSNGHETEWVSPREAELYYDKV